MNQTVLAMRNALAVACRACGVRFNTTLEDFDVDAVLEEAEAQGWDAREIACQVLFRCCVEDGQFNNFQAGFLAVANFIDSQATPLKQHRERALKDLLSILNSGPTEDAIRKWVETNYP